MEMAFETHPGVTASECSLREAVKARPYSTTADGFRCAHTGGHCLPADYCARRREMSALSKDVWDAFDRAQMRASVIDL